MKRVREQFMEYPDAPSGSVALYHYKEPFMPFDRGYGFRGVLLADEETGDLQCHFCGEWYPNLSNHIHREHNMNTAQYRDLVGLNKKTILISDQERAKLVHVHQDACLANLRSHSTPHTEATKRKISEEMKKNWETRFETKNVKGTCYLQLLNRIKEFHREHGRVPSSRDFNSSQGTFVRVFGSWTNAVRAAGFEPNKVGGHSLKSSWRYTDDQLLDAIRNFYRQHNRIPSISDCVSGLIPSYGTYQKHFGGIMNAVTQASLPAPSYKTMKERNDDIFKKRVSGIKDLISKGIRDVTKICGHLGIKKSQFYRIRERMLKK